MASEKSTSTASRAVTLDLLEQVLRHKYPLDDVLAGHSGFATLETRDRGFARLLTATVLRRIGQIDALIDHALDRPLPVKAKAVLDLLRLGVCQLFFTDTPAHAAVSTTVDLARTRGHGPHKAMVNAVLRRLSREGAALVENQDAARLNTPDWLWQSWVLAYGEKTARDIASAHLREAPLDITVKEDAAIWAGTLEAEILPTGSLRRAAGGLIPELPGFKDGQWWVQDAAAALPVKLLGDIRGKRVIDLCAAPGGKAAQMASLGADVTAIDRSEKRLVRLRQNMDRLSLSADAIIADAVTWRPKKPAHAILLDAPCSATGTIRRHPDVPRLKKPEDVSKLALVQERLLTAALDMVEPGGIVVYCACSLQPEEGPDRIKAALKADPRFQRAPIHKDEIGGAAEMLTPTGDLRTLPCHLGEKGGMDGFFAARLKRR
ncbi:MAG: MFS transporter [Proteobacteria bacterium]|nr:MFS transporter [Pseudomonadota bacterium]MDA1022996.1 MFS transporter [Pseudomonadota bacterium]